MDDLISRQAAIDELEYAAWGKEWDKALAKAMLESLPSAQPEIIRCKDCRHRGRLECPFGITVFDAPKDDEFCSHAERRTE